MSSHDLESLDGPLVLVGAGKMGGALLEGFLKLGLPPRLAVVIDPNLPPEAAAALAGAGVTINPEPESIAAPRVLLLAVKPQVAAEVLADAAPLATSGTLVLSIMAGRTLAFLESAFAPGTAIVRAMPNTPAMVGKGVSVCVPNGAVAPGGRALASTLLGTVGAVEWVEDEALMDVVTAVSGSGPAYAFLLAEEMAKAGVAAGLPAELSARIARATVAGAGALMDASDLDVATLRKNVTSPGGTTAAALGVLMDEAAGFGPLLARAIAAATARSKELAG